LDKLESEFAAKERTTPQGAPLMMLASGGDYSVCATGEGVSECSVAAVDAGRPQTQDAIHDVE